MNSCKIVACALIRNRLGICVIFALLGVYASSNAQDQHVTGNLFVDGEADIHGDTFNLGTWSGSTTLGLSVTYAEDSAHNASLGFTANRPVSTWLWQQVATISTGALQMQLNSNNALTLFDKTTSSNPAIVLDPVTRSTFTTPITFNGTDNEMPNQMYVGTGTVLTVGLADARYAVHNIGTSISLGTNATAGTQYATSLGYNTSASADGSTAIGMNANASGFVATALGQSAVGSGFASEALGIYSVADNYYSLALAPNSHASGNSASALGCYSLASGAASVALGGNAQATNAGSSALGYASQSSGSYASAFSYVSSAIGDYADALGEGSLASGMYAASFGSQSAATTFGSEALGFHAAADGNAALALGSYSHASGSCSTALGNSSVATGDYAVAAGLTQAQSIYQFTVGAYGASGGDPHLWVPTDDLFTVGNGQSAGSPSNALSVKKNGNMTVAGVITAQPGGDIPMYTGNQ